MVPVVELISLGVPTIKCGVVESTHLLSDNAHREYLASIPEGGEIPFEGNYIPTDASQLIFLTDLQARTQKTWSVTLGNTPGQSNQCIWMADGLVTNISPVAQVDDVIRFTGTIKVTGKPKIW